LPLLGVAFVAIAFFGLGQLANKIGVDSPNADALLATDALSLYLLGSLSAMDQLMNQPLVFDWGVNTFRSFLAVGQALGLDVSVPTLVKPYVYIPQPTNVYTVFLPYWQDLGWTGVFLAMAVLGWAHAALQSAALSRRDPRLMVLASLAMYPLLMQFFQDQYFSLLTTWVTFALLVWPSLNKNPHD
jgi:oligosaccharide repeat unit polymerase